MNTIPARIDFTGFKIQKYDQTVKDLVQRGEENQIKDSFYGSELKSEFNTAIK